MLHVFLHKNTFWCFKADASNWKRAVRALGRVNGFEVHQATLLIYTVNACMLWQAHYLFNSRHVLHIKTTVKYLSLQAGYVKMQAGCEIKNTVCSLIQEYIALLWKRSHAYAQDHQAVSLLGNVFQRKSSAYYCSLPEGRSINQSVQNTVYTTLTVLTPLIKKGNDLFCEISRRRLMLTLKIKC